MSSASPLPPAPSLLTPHGLPRGRPEIPFACAIFALRVRSLGWGAAFLGVSLAVASRAPSQETQAAPETPSGLKAWIAWQAALEGKGFSPGLLDGRPGAKTAAALRAYQGSAGLPATGAPDPATRASLGVDDSRGTVEYPVTRQDEELVDPCPPDWNEKSRRTRLLYQSLSSLLAEKFHTTERCLSDLNPGVDCALLKAGDRLQVPAIPAPPSPPRAERVVIDLERKMVVPLDGSGHALGLLHCSVARDLVSVVRGTAKVATVVVDPGYTFDPARWPEVKNVEKKLSIPPGPRSPVGVRWIGLDRPGVGIHGSPEPEKIGKTGSHGCFRLTNWDAVRLACQVAPGTPVEIVDRSPIVDAFTR